MNILLLVFSTVFGLNIIMRIITFTKAWVFLHLKTMIIKVVAGAKIERFVV